MGGEDGRTNGARASSRGGGWNYRGGGLMYCTVLLSTLVVDLIWVEGYSSSMQLCAHCAVCVCVCAGQSIEAIYYCRRPAEDYQMQTIDIGKRLII